MVFSSMPPRSIRRRRIERGPAPVTFRRRALDPLRAGRHGRGHGSRGRRRTGKSTADPRRLRRVAAPSRQSTNPTGTAIAEPRGERSSNPAVAPLRRLSTGSAPTPLVPPDPPDATTPKWLSSPRPGGKRYSGRDVCNSARYDLVRAMGPASVSNLGASTAGIRRRLEPC
jgi:hypothetical protein